jgi:hypothetical protein
MRRIGYQVEAGIAFWIEATSHGSPRFLVSFVQALGRGVENSLTKRQSCLASLLWSLSASLISEGVSPVSKAGFPFEKYIQLGILLDTNPSNNWGHPVDTTGEIIRSGDPGLDGPVKDPMEMIERLATSERVNQVCVRHVFRYWMGRNETINDAPILQAAYRAYRDNDGSMKALLTSLLTSDAFLYRKTKENEP